MKNNDIYDTVAFTNQVGIWKDELARNLRQAAFYSAKHTKSADAAADYHLQAVERLKAILAANGVKDA